jgi:hypothetical protein
MNALSKKSLFAASSILFASSLFSINVNAQTSCMSGLLLNTIVNTGSTGYSCDLGGLQYTFYDNLAELNNPNAKINFQDFGSHQNIIFTNLTSQGTFIFNYDVISPNETVERIELSYDQYPRFPTPIQTNVLTSPFLPSSPSKSPISIETIFIPDDISTPPYQTVTTMTHTIYKTPAPISLVGLGALFGFSRNIRRRINKAKG